MRYQQFKAVNCISLNLFDIYCLPCVGRISQMQQCVHVALKLLELSIITGPLWNSMQYLPLVKPSVFRWLVSGAKQNMRLLRSVVKQVNIFAVLSSAVHRTYFMGNRCLPVMNHIFLGFDWCPCRLGTGYGVISPHYLLSVIRVRLSVPDKPGWFPCHFDGHQFDLLSFPWLPLGMAWNPRWYLFHHFLSVVCLVKIRHANISAALNAWCHLAFRVFFSWKDYHTTLRRGYLIHTVHVPTDSFKVFYVSEIIKMHLFTAVREIWSIGCLWNVFLCGGSAKYFSLMCFRTQTTALLCIGGISLKHISTFIHSLLSYISHYFWMLYLYDLYQGQQPS